MWGKTAYLLLFIFVILIVLPVVLIKGILWKEKEAAIILKVYHHHQDKIVLLELEDYLRGVVAAEMPAKYHPQALKAQAVAARTYTLQKLPAYGGTGSQAYPGADLSTDFRYCQAWLSQKEMKARWGFVAFFYYWARINNAVEETKGEVLSYQGDLIEAVYHANSGGYTENARDVWGGEKPYLISVESPYDQESKNYQSTFYIALQDVLSKLQIATQDSQWQLAISKTNDTGLVLEAEIAGQAFSGKELREKLGLPSAKFTVTQQGDILAFQVLGKGHGVGMSQDGANGLAQLGYNYQEILQHYYPNTIISRLKK